MRTGVKGDGMCAGGTATANSDPREGVQNGQRQHHVKECVRGHGSGDVVGIMHIQGGWNRERRHGKVPLMACRRVGAKTSPELRSSRARHIIKQSGTSPKAHYD